MELIPLVVLATAASSITVYNEDFGVVRDTVPLDLQKGINNISYSGVTTRLEPESVVLWDSKGKVKFSVIEQGYRGDPVDEMRLLQMFEGKTIRFLKMMEGREVTVEGKIVRAPVQVMAKDEYNDQYQKTLEPIIEVSGQLQTSLPGTPIFPSLGDDSVLLPTLSWKLFSNMKASVDAQLSYLTYGMSWKADYNLVFPEKGDDVTITGWVSIENNTGTRFKDAKIKLMAGDVNKVELPSQSRRRTKKLFLSAMEAAPDVEEKKFDEFHMYTLPLPTTLRDGETKQVEFIRGEKVKTKKYYVYDGFPNRYYGDLNVEPDYGRNSQPDVAIYRELENSKENGLGVPLPAGRTRFYRMDDDSQLEFTGENTIDHTPKNETVRVYLGNAFDLVGERKRTNFTKHRTMNRMTEAFEIEIRNRSDETATVNIVEHLCRWSNWKIRDENYSYKKKAAQTIEFPVVVEPDGSTTVTYTVEYTW